jgi:hypothetical protein
VKESDIDQTKAYDYATMKGNHKAHHIHSVNCHDPTQVQYKDVSYFCPCCVDGNFKFQCEQMSHVP